jgi:chromosome partitioning protein
LTDWKQLVVTPPGRFRGRPSIRPKVKGGAAKLVRGKRYIGGLIKGTDFECLGLLPADFSYRHMDLAPDGAKRPTRRLARVLAPVADEYDYIFIDCPPSISLVSESCSRLPTRCSSR